MKVGVVGTRLAPPIPSVQSVFPNEVKGPCHNAIIMLCGYEEHFLGEGFAEEVEEFAGEVGLAPPGRKWGRK